MLLKSRKKMLLGLWLWRLCVVLGSVSGSRVAFSAPPVETPSAPLQAQAINSVTEAAVKAGVLTCAHRIDQISKYLTAGSLSGAFLFPSTQQPDESVYSASFELQGPKTLPLYVSTSFSPKSSGGCDAVYDAVQYSASSCDDVQRSTFQSLKSQGTVRKEIVVLSAGALKVFLMPAGTGCGIIKKEIVQ